MKLKMKFKKYLKNYISELDNTEEEELKMINYFINSKNLYVKELLNRKFFIDLEEQNRFDIYPNEVIEIYLDLTKMYNVFVSKKSNIIDDLIYNRYNKYFEIKTKNIKNITFKSDIIKEIRKNVKKRSKIKIKLDNYSSQLNLLNKLE